MAANEQIERDKNPAEQNVEVDPCDPLQHEQPYIDTLMAWDAEGGCEAVDGCWTEPDGHCPHGCPSWLLALGLI